VHFLIPTPPCLLTVFSSLNRLGLTLCSGHAEAYIWRSLPEVQTDGACSRSCSGPSCRQLEVEPASAAHLYANDEAPSTYLQSPRLTPTLSVRRLNYPRSGVPHLLKLPPHPPPSSTSAPSNSRYSTSTPTALSSSHKRHTDSNGVVVPRYSWDAFPRVRLSTAAVLGVLTSQTHAQGTQFHRTSIPFVQCLFYRLDLGPPQPQRLATTTDRVEDNQLPALSTADTSPGVSKHDDWVGVSSSS
jgi:hypothetical protein